MSKVIHYGNYYICLNIKHPDRHFLDSGRILKWTQESPKYAWDITNFCIGQQGQQIFLYKGPEKKITGDHRLVAPSAPSFHNYNLFCSFLSALQAW